MSNFGALFHLQSKKMHSFFRLSFLLFALFLQQIAFAQNLPQPLETLIFNPQYILPGKAGHYPGNQQASAMSRFERFQMIQNGFTFKNEQPTEIKHNLLQKPFPQKAFTIEILLNHHVNKPIASAVYAYNPKTQEPQVLLTYFSERDSKNAEITFSIGNQWIESKGAKPFQQYWYHIAATFQNGKMEFFINGQSVGNKEVNKTIANNLQLDIAAYLKQEPYMQLANTIKEVQLYDQALNAEQVKKRYQTAKNQVERGEIYTHLFHLSAGPYLHFATQTSVNLLWETNVPATAMIEYGTELPLKNKVELNAIAVKADPNHDAFIQEITLSNLQPHTKYFYNIKLRNYDGQTMESGVFTFQTAVKEGETFQFAAIGDTETRPHVNDKLAKLIWGERPDFVLHMGDLTDGGMKDHKWQWNYEYFAGLTQLHTRIPVFPVAGNGEADLYWYKKYHVLPNEEAYYTFHYGNADYFMLNSNQSKEQFKPDGEQYIWLEKELAKSTAPWKFVCMHHAPYSTDEDDYGNAWEGKSDQGDLDVRQLVPLFEKYKVDIVFFGHLHSYSRMGPIQNNTVKREEGVWYIQTGGAGGNLEDFAPTRAWFAEKTYAGHHYCLVNVNGKHLNFKMYDTEGRLRDFFELKKE